MVTNRLRLIGAMEHKDPSNGSGLLLIAISGTSGNSFPGVVANAKMRGPAQAAVTVLLFRIEAAEFHRLQGEDVSLTGLFLANPTAEMHGA
jgi:hypothetical protein